MKRYHVRYVLNRYHPNADVHRVRTTMTNTCDIILAIAERHSVVPAAVDIHSILPIK